MTSIVGTTQAETSKDAKQAECPADQCPRQQRDYKTNEAEQEKEKQEKKEKMKKSWREQQLLGLAREYEEQIVENDPKNIEDVELLIDVYNEETRDKQCRRKSRQWKRRSRLRGTLQACMNKITENHKMKIRKMRRKQKCAIKKKNQDREPKESDDEDPDKSSKDQNNKENEFNDKDQTEAVWTKQKSTADSPEVIMDKSSENILEMFLKNPACENKHNYISFSDQNFLETHDYEQSCIEFLSTGLWNNE